MKPLSLSATFLLMVVVPGRTCLAFRPDAFIPASTGARPLFYHPRSSLGAAVQSESRPGAFFERVKGSSSTCEREADESSDSVTANNNRKEWRQRILRRSGIVMRRLVNPLSFANINTNDDSTHQKVLLAGGSGIASSVGSVVKSVWGRVKKLHDPKVYMIASIVAGIRWSWMMRSIFYWFAFGFLIKWHRARYVFKIPVWDRQPNWNNVITSKEQEKDLHALTCKNCGSTLFVAKSREFFFEGSTGIGGLGCFTCGAKGKDNFYEDRDRIVEDVADMDDYFEYERPLDLISAYERRKLLKETKGDEEKANQILSARLEDSTDTIDATTTTTTAAVEAPETSDSTTTGENATPPPAEEEEEEEPQQNQQPPEGVVLVEEKPKTSLPPQPKPKQPVQPPTATMKSTSPTPSLGLRRSKPADDDDLDLLGMDEF